MEFSSSEDDELIEDYVDLEDDINVEQQTAEVSVPLQFLDQPESSMVTVAQSVGTEFLADGDIKNHQDQDPYLGMEFDSDSTAKNFYNAYALRLGFGIRVARSRSERRKGVEVLVMKRFVCLKEGHHKKKVTDYTIKKKRKRLSIRDGCPAMMEIVRRGPERWVVTKLVLEHTHIVVGPERVREFQLNHLWAKDQEHENYLREMRQRLFGEGDAQGLLEYFKKIQAMDAGFFYAVQVDGRNCLANVFWADAKARMYYSYFGDAVTFDTTYKKNENMMPFATFTGVNHHCQPVVFGCALVIDKTEASFAWLFETWLTAMFNRHPISLTTDQGNAMGRAVAKVFPNTCHRLCKWHILLRCKKKLCDVYPRSPNFHIEFKKCVNECETEEGFERCWSLILDKYNLRQNSWLQSLYNIRHKWIPAYILKRSFFAELSPMQRLESMNRFYRKHFDSKVSLQAFIAKFNQSIDGRYEREAQDDFTTLHSEHNLKINSPMEKQAADIYTRAVFERFQVELIEAFSHYAVKIQDGTISRYSVHRHEDAHSRHIVVFDASERKVNCSCFKFENSGMLCRHVLGVFLGIGVLLIPEHYILKRWTKKAKTGFLPEEQNVELQMYTQHSPILRYNELFRDAMKCAEKGAISSETYKMAKEMLQKAFAEIVGLEESVGRRG